jgi:hypothetical protein
VADAALVATAIVVASAAEEYSAAMATFAQTALDVTAADSLAKSAVCSRAAVANCDPMAKVALLPSDGSTFMPKAYSWLAPRVELTSIQHRLVLAPITLCWAPISWTSTSYVLDSVYKLTSKQAQVRISKLVTLD